MIGILGAMAVEVDAIKTALEHSQLRSVSGMDFVSGDLEGVPCVVVQCGIGKVNAAVCAQALIHDYHPDLCVNVGVGGSLAPSLKLGDIAIADRVVQHDVDTSALGDPVGMVSTVNRIFFDCDPDAVARLREAIDSLDGVHGQVGAMATGDQFVSDAQIKQLIVQRFDAICCDMESGAIAQTCLLNGVPFAAVRAISDNADDDSPVDFPQFARSAAARSIEVLRRFVKRTISQ